MTLKQFAKLSACCLVALVFYGLDFHPIIKYAAIFFFVSLGIGLAFLPINERPLDIWIVSFIKSIFSPTQYVWKKDPDSVLPQPPSAPSASVQAETTLIKASQEEQLIKQVLPVAPQNGKENEFLQNIQSLFASGPIVKPKLEIKMPIPEEKIAAVAPVMSKEKASPFFTSLPNVITGIVKDKQGKLVDGVILEIKDSRDLAVRALRSNKLGQFRITTPLPDGSYTITSEKEGLDFDIIKVELKGEVFPQIEISAKQTP